MFGFIKRKMTAITIFTMMAFSSAAMATDLATTIAGIESGGDYTATNGKALGAYQFNTIALKDIGYKVNGQWTASSGVTSDQEFLNCQACQVKAENVYLNKEWSYENSSGMVSKYLGTTGSNGITYNQSALLECGYQMGTTGCSDYLANGNSCTNTYCQSVLAQNPHFVNDIAKASESDSSAITGGNLSVDNSSLAKGGTISNGTATAAMDSYCAAEVNKMLQQAGSSAVDNATTLAANSGTGFTLMNGKGILDDSLANGGGIGNLGGSSDDSSISDMLGGSLTGAGYEAASCLDNMLGELTSFSGGFSNFSLSSLLQQAASMVCSRVQSQFSELLQPAYNLVSDVDSDSYIGGGGYLPGMQIGYVNMGTGGSNLFENALEKTSWYQSAQQSSGGNNLFENNQTYTMPLFSSGSIYGNY